MKSVRDSLGLEKRLLSMMSGVLEKGGWRSIDDVKVQLEGEGMHPDDDAAIRRLEARRDMSAKDKVIALKFWIQYILEFTATFTDRRAVNVERPGCEHNDCPVHI